MILNIALLIINGLIFLNFKKFAKIVNIYDTPDNKLKLHKNKTPILGGLILAINYLLYFSYQFFFIDQFTFVTKEYLNIREVISIFFLIVSFFLLGLFDDKYYLSPGRKLFYSIILITISLLLNDNLIISKISVSFLEKKIFFKNFSIFLTIFCILILTNSLNFFDGINGQSCTFFIVIYLFLFFVSDMNIFYLTSIMFILLILFFNLKNKLFLGDGGIFLLSIIASISLIYEYNVNKNILYADEIFFLLLFPGLDLLRLTMVRIYNGKNAFYGDRNHIHHLLIKKISLLNTNLILFSLSIFPILLFSFAKLNFYMTFLIIVILYSFLLLILTKKTNKNSR